MVSGMLGLVWYCALLVPPASRSLLWCRQWGDSLAALGIMCIASIVTTTLLKQPIVKAKGIILNSLMAALIPCVGCVLFWFQISTLSLIYYVWSSAFHYHPFYMQTAVKLDLGDHLNHLWLIPLVALYLSMKLLYYVVIPIGCVSQLVLRRIGGNLGTSVQD
jgi:hypothetical protein